MNQGAVNKASKIVEAVTIPGYGVACARASKNESEISNSPHHSVNRDPVAVKGSIGQNEKDSGITASGFFDLVSEDAMVQKSECELATSLSAAGDSRNR